jgi:hypothetical protein
VLSLRRQGPALPEGPSPEPERRTSNL